MRWGERGVADGTGRGGTGRGWRRMGRGRTGRGAADGLPGAPHQLQVGHRPVRHEAVHLAPQRDGRQRVLEQPPGEQSRQLLHRFARGPCRGARSQVGRRGPPAAPLPGRHGYLPWVLLRGPGPSGPLRPCCHGYLRPPSEDPLSRAPAPAAASLQRPQMPGVVSCDS